MKLDGMKCPHCGGNNTYAWQIERTNLFDDRTYEVLKREFESPLLSTDTDNVIYKCKCEECEKHFSTMVLLEVKIKKTICKKTIQEVMSLK